VLAAGDDGADVRKRVAVTQVGAGHVGSREVADDEYQPARRLGPEVHLQRATAATANHRSSTKIQLITRPPTGEWSIVMVVCVCVCVCVCVFVRDHIFGTTRRIFTTFLCMLPIAVARSSSDGVVI